MSLFSLLFIVESCIGIVVADAIVLLYISANSVIFGGVSVIIGFDIKFGSVGVGIGIDSTEIVGTAVDTVSVGGGVKIVGCSETSVGTTGSPIKPVFVNISPCCNVGVIVFNI